MEDLLEKLYTCDHPRCHAPGKHDVELEMRYPDGGGWNQTWNVCGDHVKWAEQEKAKTKKASMRAWKQDKKAEHLEVLAEDDSLKQARQELKKFRTLAKGLKKDLLALVDTWRKTAKKMAANKIDDSFRIRAEEMGDLADELERVVLGRIGRGGRAIWQ
jgi:hypothetical protein